MVVSSRPTSTATRSCASNEAPAVEVHIVQSAEPPGGMGEAGTSLIVPAVANAIFAATGKRLRKMPVDAAALKRAGEGRRCDLRRRCDPSLQPLSVRPKSTEQSHFDGCAWAKRIGRCSSCTLPKSTLRINGLARPALCSILRRNPRVLHDLGKLRDVGAKPGVEFIRRAADRLVAAGLEALDANQAP